LKLISRVARPHDTTVQTLSASVCSDTMLRLQMLEAKLFAIERE